MTITQIVLMPDGTEKAQEVELPDNFWGNPQSKALSRLEGKCSATIYSGITVNNKHYSLSKNQQGYIDTAMKAINAGATSYILAADNEEPSIHTAYQIKEIDKLANEWGAVNINYLEKLTKWIKRETDNTILSKIDYGVKLPDDLMTELGTLLSGINIDITKYSSMFKTIS